MSLPETTCVAQNIFPTNPESRVVNTNLPGVACLSSFDGLLVLNNLCRNIEICRPAANKLISLCRYAKSIFPSGTEDSEFDLDFHTFIHDVRGKRLLALNHNGRLLAFSTDWFPKDDCTKDGASDTMSIEIEPECEAQWLSDVESTILVGDHLVSSSPTGYCACDPAQTGFFVSPSLNFDSDQLFGSDGKIERRNFFAELGLVTAVTCDALSQNLAFAAGQTLHLTRPARKGDLGLEFEQLTWSRQLDFHITWIAVLDSKTLICAGPDLADENLPKGHYFGGGGFALVDLETGGPVNVVKFDLNLAWGNGGYPLTLSPNRSSLIGVDRRANLYAWQLATRNPDFELICRSNQEANTLRIAHLIQLNDRLYCGSMDDGFQLRFWDVPASI